MNERLCCLLQDGVVLVIHHLSNKENFGCGDQVGTVLIITAKTRGVIMCPVDGLGLISFP